MEKITFGVKNKNGYELKLCVCEEAKLIEYGQCLTNSDSVNIYLLNETQLKKLYNHYLIVGYKETKEEFPH